MINVINYDSLILLLESLQSDFSSGGICFTVNTETPIIPHCLAVKVRQRQCARQYIYVFRKERDALLHDKGRRRVLDLV